MTDAPEYDKPEDDPDVQEAANVEPPPENAIIPGDSDHELSPVIDDADDSTFDDDEDDTDADSDEAEDDPVHVLDVEEGEG